MFVCDVCLLKQVILVEALLPGKLLDAHSEMESSE